MTEHYRPIADLLQRVRARWRTLVLLRATVRAALAASAILALLILTAQVLPRSPLALALLGTGGLVAAGLTAIWALLPARDVPSDARLARFIEEHVDGLEQRLVSAVDVATLHDEDTRPAFAASMVRDAARAASAVDAAAVVPQELLRRAGFQAAAALLLVGSLAFSGRGVGRRALDAASLTLFPSRIVLEVTPGNARLQLGSNLVVRARLVGNSAPVAAQFLRTQSDDQEEWRSVDMERGADGGFTLSLNALTSSFKYRVVAGAATSDTFAVAVVRAPRVTRIDVEYTYPKSFGLASRTEEDSGDIYAPAGTDVRLRIHTDAAAASGRMLLGGDTAIDLSPEGDRQSLSGSLKVMADDAYRVTLTDAEGFASRGDTEYFIRTMEDRSPEVRVVKPASDRRVTPLEEVDIEAEAADDFGVASLEFVYSVRGAKETVVPIRIPANQTTVTASHTLYLEDLDVRPGDFVSYYLRARDLARGKRSSEARSDIFFLEIKNFEEEFTLAQSQAAMGGGASNPQLEELVAAQKEIIVATWKLDRRSQAARGAQSEQDIRSVAAAESELRARVERMSSSLRTGVMRDPRARSPVGRGGQPQGNVRAGQTLSEEDAMIAAAAAMAQAVTALNALKTANAIAPEMEALNQLLKAQADVKKREVQRQQAGSGSGGNRATQDLSSLFDKELARHQQTNYETPSSSAQHEEPQASAIDKIKDLARRQDELLKRQQELAHQRTEMSPEQQKRELDKLTRDQNELRQRAEELAQQLARKPEGESGDQKSPGGQQSQSGQQGQQGRTGQSGQAVQPGPSTQSAQSQRGQQESGQQESRSARTDDSGRRMREVSEEMRASASELRRQDADEASTRSARALSKLRDLERQLQTDSPDGRRRALGDLQLEAHQIADAERRLAAEAARSGEGPAPDTMRRLAGEQDRLADRVRRVQEALKDQARASTSAGKDGTDAKALQQAAGEASREIERQRLAERMEQSADAMRARAGESPQTKAGESAQKGAGSQSGGQSAPGAPQAEHDIARSLDRLADRLASASQSGDDESRRLTGRLARAQEIRERLDDVTRRLGELGQRGNPAQGGGQPGQQAGDASSSAPQRSPGNEGRSGEARSGSGDTTAGVEELRSEMNREIAALRELLDQTRREETTEARAGTGVTFEGRGMTLSSPGTEAFKQDFARWQELSRQATVALEAVESAASRRLSERRRRIG